MKSRIQVSSTMVKSPPKANNGSTRSKHSFHSDSSYNYSENLQKTERTLHMRSNSKVYDYSFGEQHEKNLENTLDFEQFKTAICTYDESSKERMMMKMRMIVDDEYSYIQNQHKLDINELSHTYMTNKQNKEIIKLKKKVAMLERKLNAKTSNYICFSILNSLYNIFIDDISDTHKAYNDERKSLVKKHKLNNRSFAFSKNMNLCTHSKNSNYKKGIISNQNSTERLYSYKENDVSPFLKSYSTFTTPRKSDKRESAETPMICKVYPEQFPTKDEFSLK